jgi:hypothetical protein
MNKIVVFKWDSSKPQLFPSGNIHATKTIYNAHYVNRHYDSLIKVASEEFSYICITDNPKDLSNEIEVIPLWDKCKNLGGCYNRMFIFSKEMKNLIGNKFLTIDLDTTFIKDFSYLFNNNKTTVHKTSVYHPGISLIIAGDLSEVWESFYNTDIPKNIQNSRVEFNGTDQAWFNYYLQNYQKIVI